MQQRQAFTCTIFCAAALFLFSFSTLADGASSSAFNIRCPISERADLYVNTYNFWVGFTLDQYSTDKKINPLDTLNVKPGDCRECYEVTMGTPPKGIPFGRNNRDILIMHLRKSATRAHPPNHSRYHVQIDILNENDVPLLYLPDTHCFDNNRR